MENAAKFKKLVHYVCSQCSGDVSKLGAVKLNKALWLSDLVAYYQLGQPITSARYVKRQFGPVPSSIVQTVKELEREGALTVRTVDHFGNQKKEYIVLKPVTGDFLSPEERRIADAMISYVCNEHTATSISEQSHDHIWKAAEDGEELPLFTVFAKPGIVTDDEREWAMMKLEEATA